jgi:hypothetical protein
MIWCLKKNHAYSPFQAVYSVIHQLCTWFILQKATSRTLVVAASQQLVQAIMVFFSRGTLVVI